jgi:phenol 2-monooxygenase (NADPH)
VRPDQHVGHVLPLQAREALAGYFAAIFRVRR